MTLAAVSGSTMGLTGMARKTVAAYLERIRIETYVRRWLRRASLRRNTRGFERISRAPAA
jgi:hypothetical protein